MKASYNWLKSLVPGLTAEPAEVGERLTRSGLEIEEIIEYGAASPHILVVQVVKIEPHPKREKLQLVTVDLGERKQVVVCGADNVPAPGGKVVLAPLGCVLPRVELTVEPRPIGGIVSEGMLCSEEELGLVNPYAKTAGKGAGILVLKLNVPLGTPLSKAIPASHDFVFDIAVTPNRPDALGHIGLAREIATLFEIDFQPPTAAAPKAVALGEAIGDYASVDVQDTERCPHYGAAVVKDITVGPSPAWLRYRLESLGIRALSNVVDVTNLVLLEFSQPMHAFDLDRLSEASDGKKKIVVRRAADAEKLTTLDAVERTLSTDDLLITDGARGVALAGIMGGENTDIGADAKTVLLECAYFTPRGIRRSGRRHALHSESSHRFERGCDPEVLPDVLAHAASLLTHICGGKAVPSLIMAGTALAERKRVGLRRSKMASLLGIDIDMTAAQAVLTRLGFEVSRSSENVDELEVGVPGFRPDVTREEDLIEEVMRIHGIDALPATSRSLRLSYGRSAPTQDEQLRKCAQEIGLSEALVFGFTSDEAHKAVHAAAGVVRLQNPLTEERSVMRTSLLPGLLEATRRAHRHGNPDVRFFSLGRCFLPSAEGEPLPREGRRFCAVLSGSSSHGLGHNEELDVFHAKWVAVELLGRSMLKTVQIEPVGGAELTHLHPRARGFVVVDGQRVGNIGRLHPDVMDALGFERDVMVVEIDLEVLPGSRPLAKYRAIPVLPAVFRDLSFSVNDDVRASALQKTIAQAAGDLCESVRLFDLYRGKGVIDGEQALTFQLVFRDPKASSDPKNARTLTDPEVDACAKAVVAAAKQSHGASLR